MILRIGKKYAVSCDACDTVLGYFHSFEEAREAIYKSKWATERFGEDWYNWCTKCKEL